MPMTRAVLCLIIASAIVITAIAFQNQYILGIFVPLVLNELAHSTEKSALREKADTAEAGAVDDSPSRSTVGKIGLMFLTLGILPVVSGCAQQQQATTQPAIDPFVSALVDAVKATGPEVGADILTSEMLSKIKDPAQRVNTAKTLYDVAGIVRAATGPTPDYSAVKALAAAEIGKTNSPYSPVILVLVNREIDVAQQQTSSATTTPQGAEAQRIIRDATIGIQDAALLYYTPPTTQPVPIPAG